MSSKQLILINFYSTNTTIRGNYSLSKTNRMGVVGMESIIQILN